MTEQNPLTVFVPNGDSAHETAVLLTGTATEYGLPQNEIKVSATNGGGFMISERIAEAVWGDDFPDEIEDAVADPDLGQTGEQEPVEETAPVVEEDADLPPYEEWDYPDLKTEVVAREIEVADQRKETLVAALNAFDAANPVEDDETAAVENSDDAL